MKTGKSFQIALFSLLVGLTACGDDDFQPGDSGPAVEDSIAHQDSTTPQDGPAPQQDQGQVDPPGPVFFIQGRILFDPNLGCAAANAAADCKGKLYWGIWPKNPAQEDPGLPIYFAEVPDAQHGTTFSANDVPIAPEMYMVAFVDDNSSIGPTNVPWPDQGDPLAMDLEPFSATEGQTVLKEVTFWARMP